LPTESYFSLILLTLYLWGEFSDWF